MVDSSTFYNSPVYSTLVERILERVRVVVTRVVGDYRLQQLESSLLSQDVVSAVVDELRLTVQNTVETEAASGATDDQVIRSAVSAARPRVEAAVRAVVQRNPGLQVSSSFYTSGVYASLVERVLDDVRIVAEQELSVVRSRLVRAGQIVVEEVLVEISPQIRGIVRDVLVSSQLM